MKFLTSDSNLNFLSEKDVVTSTSATTSTMVAVQDQTYDKIESNFSNIVNLVLTNVSYLENNSLQKVINENMFNISSESGGAQSENSTYIFDRLDVRIIFITLYTLVFCCCFFGEWLLF